MTRFRLKLITLPWELEVPTLGLASLAAVTPDAFDIAIVDLLRERLFLDEEVETTLNGLTALIEPLLIVFLGVTVGGIAICMFLPIFKLSELVAGNK